MEPPYSYGLPIFAGVLFSLWSLIMCYYFGCRQRTTHDRGRGGVEGMQGNMDHLQSLNRDDASRSTVTSGEPTGGGKRLPTIREESADDDEMRQNVPSRNNNLMNYMYFTEYIL